MIYQYPSCEFEATRQATLDDHVETKHKETEKMMFNCMKCEKVFEYKFLLENHICFICQKCKFIASSAQSLKEHNQTLHTIVKVDILQKVLIECKFCEYKCKFNIQLKKHISKHHESSELKNLKYKCEACDFSSDFYLYICEHKITNHDKVVENDEMKTMNIALRFLVEQNIELINELENMKKDMKEAFGLLADKLEDQTNTSNEIKQELLILRNHQQTDKRKSDKKDTSRADIEVRTRADIEVMKKSIQGEKLKTKRHILVQ